MATKAEQSEIKLEIGLPQGSYPKTMYFNRFRVDRDAGFCLVQFGLVVASDLVDSYSVVLSAEALTENKDRLLEYLARIGRAMNGPAAWKGLPASRQTDVADFVAMAFRGGSAETCFFVFSVTAATGLKRGASAPTPLLAQPLVLLRSSPELQKQVIAALYED